MSDVTDWLRPSERTRGCEPLGVLDQMIGTLYVPQAFCFRETLDAAALKRSLVAALDRIPALAGRLAVAPGGRWEVRSGGRGVPFTTAASAIRWAEWGVDAPLGRGLGGLFHPTVSLRSERRIDAPLGPADRGCSGREGHTAPLGPDLPAASRGDSEAPGEGRDPVERGHQRALQGRGVEGLPEAEGLRDIQGADHLIEHTERLRGAGALARSQPIGDVAHDRRDLEIARYRGQATAWTATPSP